LKIILILL